MSNLTELAPGDCLGRYQLLMPLGQGGMASVWAARLRGSRGFTKTVALKMLLPQAPEQLELEKMLVDEARLASRIRHPHAAEILDVGEDRGLLYMVMEWIDGESVASLRRKAGGRIPWPLVVRIGMDVCSALSAAHQLADDQGVSLGLVHRDISPQNLMVTYRGATKLLDFGVMKARGRTVEATLAGTVKGKPSYMSPEQGLGGAVDGRSDLFSLGIVLYELLTGEHPFGGFDGLERLRNIIANRPVRPPSLGLGADCPTELEPVILRALAHDPSLRFSEAAHMEQALAAVSPAWVTHVELARFLGSVCGAEGRRRRATLVHAVTRLERSLVSEVLSLPAELGESSVPWGEAFSGFPVELGDLPGAEGISSSFRAPYSLGLIRSGTLSSWLALVLPGLLIATGAGFLGGSWRVHGAGTLRLLAEPALSPPLARTRGVTAEMRGTATSLPPKPSAEQGIPSPKPLRISPAGHATGVLGAGGGTAWGAKSLPTAAALPPSPPPAPPPSLVEDIDVGF